MFEGLFHGLRAEGVPVAMDEWLALQDALGHGLAGSRLSGLYLLARAVCVKSERHYDAYDVAFARYFGGAATTTRSPTRSGGGWTSTPATCG